MQHQKAIDMLAGQAGYRSGEQQWIDFGCGTGTFTLALAHHLSTGSQIIAIDKDQNALNKIPDNFKQVNIEKRVGNFVEDNFSFKNQDGILMANSLHYVQYKTPFLEKIKSIIKPNGCFLVVEYDTSRSNPWIPYPVSFDQLNKLFTKAGFSTIKKLNERPSRYNRSNLYSAFICNEA